MSEEFKLGWHDDLETYVATNADIDDEGVVCITPDAKVVALSIDEDEAEREFALRSLLEDWESNVIPCRYNDNIFEVCGQGYLVVTDGEADDAWDKELDSYIDDCLDIPANIMPYFDRKAWKTDARHDGRGHSLAKYDGDEQYIEIENLAGSVTTFYIYRQY